MTWEYKVVQTQESATHGVIAGANLEEQLNALAKQGWELYQVVTYSTAERSATINHYFRREVRDLGREVEGPAPESSGTYSAPFEPF